MKYTYKLENKLEDEWTMKRQQAYDKLCQETWEQKWQLNYTELQVFDKDKRQSGISQICPKAEPQENYMSPLITQSKSVFDVPPSCVLMSHIEEDMTSLFYSYNKVFGKKWQQRYSELVEFSKHTGHCNVPQKYFPNHELGIWVSIQRREYKKSRSGKPSLLTPYQIESLEKLGFQWSLKNINDAIWQQRYKELVDFKKNNGHCNVPHRYLPNKALGVWVSTQRREYRKKSSCLTVSRIESLEKLGFQWCTKNLIAETWKQRYEELVDFRQINGHCNVPNRYLPNMALGVWVATQRREYKKGILGKPSRLTASRIKCLLKIDFQWKVRKDASWQQRYKELVDFKNKFGHCNVPRNYIDNTALGEWVYAQRRSKRQSDWRPSRLAAHRVEALDKIGFQWRTKVSKTKNTCENQCIVE